MSDCAVDWVRSKMPRSSSVVPRVTLQTSAAASRTSQKQASRLSSARDSPKVALDQPSAALSTKNNELEVPDSQPPASQGIP